MQFPSSIPSHSDRQQTSIQKLKGLWQAQEIHYSHGFGAGKRK